MITIKRLSANSFIRFALVGLCNTAIGLGVTFVLLHAAGLSYWYATFSGNLLGGIFSYFMNRSFTFRSRQPMLKSSILFFVTIVCCYFISFLAGREAALWISAHSGFLPETYWKDAAVLISTGVYFILNYTGQKTVVFKDRQKSFKEKERGTNDQAYL
jgi:putative flippase GtrA